MELHGAALSAASRDSEWQLGLPARRACATDPVARVTNADAHDGWSRHHLPGTTLVTRARVRVMSIRSPGLMFSSTLRSSILRVTTRPSSVATVTEGTVLSIDF